MGVEPTSELDASGRQDPRVHPRRYPVVPCTFGSREQLAPDARGSLPVLRRPC